MRQLQVADAAELDLAKEALFLRRVTFEIDLERADQVKPVGEALVLGNAGGAPTPMRGDVAAARKKRATSAP